MNQERLSKLAGIIQEVKPRGLYPHKPIPKDIVIRGESVEDRIKDCLNGACYWPGKTDFDEDDSDFYEHGLAEKIAKMMCDVFGVDHTSKLPHNIKDPLEDAVYMETTADQGSDNYPDKPLSYGNESEIIEVIYTAKKEFEKYVESRNVNINEIERNPGDMIQNHLDDIEEHISTINCDNLSELAMRIQDAVEKIRYLTVDEQDIRY
jgi:hypothetical protein